MPEYFAEIVRSVSAYHDASFGERAELGDRSDAFVNLSLGTDNSASRAVLEPVIQTGLCGQVIVVAARSLECSRVSSGSDRRVTRWSLPRTKQLSVASAMSSSPRGTRDHCRPARWRGISGASASRWRI